MNKTISKAKLLDAKSDNARRYRNILANSGDMMESGEIRDIKNMYVMDYDGKLIRIADLDTDPDKQTEHYSVKAQADHGEVVDGMMMPTIEKQFGSCKVWLEEDGLHARMYFADEDKLADHAWAISQDASYSIGTDWYPDGYYGTGYEIDEPIGILREVSMVLTGNDPRAKTIDTKGESQAQGSDETDGDKTNEKENDMSKDALTPDEKGKLLEELNGIIDRFTTEAPESETEPTAREAKDAVDEAPAEAPKEAEATEAPAEKPAEKAEEPKADKKAEVEETKDNIKSMPVVTIKDSAVKQEITMTEKKDWLTSKDGRIAFADCLRQAGGFNARFDSLWQNECEKHMKLDGVTGLPMPIITEQVFKSAVEKSDGILSKFAHINSKAYRGHILAPGAGEQGRAHGHKKGDTKVFEEITDTYRDVFVKMVYKKLDLDATEIYENPELIDFRTEELAVQIIHEIERAAIIGDGRSAGTPDLRMFDGTRGFYSVKEDAAAASGYGSQVATTLTTTPAQAANLYERVLLAKKKIKAEGRQFLVAKADVVTALRLAKFNGGYFIQPGGSIENVLDVSAIYTPTWMDLDADNDAYLITEGAYKTIGENTIDAKPFFDTTKNQNILLDESPRGGSLDTYKSAVALASAGYSA